MRTLLHSLFVGNTVILFPSIYLSPGFLILQGWPGRILRAFNSLRAAVLGDLCRREYI
jgi:hypothetical protein